MSGFIPPPLGESVWVSRYLTHPLWCVEIRVCVSGRERWDCVVWAYGGECWRVQNSIAEVLDLDADVIARNDAWIKLKRGYDWNPIDGVKADQARKAESEARCRARVERSSALSAYARDSYAKAQRRSGVRLSGEPLAQPFNLAHPDAGGSTVAGTVSGSPETSSVCCPDCGNADIASSKAGCSACGSRQAFTSESRSAAREDANS